MPSNALKLLIHALTSSVQTKLPFKLRMDEYLCPTVNYGCDNLIMLGLPKLVANVSSQFHHLVNIGLTVGSLVKWLPIKVVHTLT